MLLLVTGIVLVAILVIIVAALVQRPTSAWRAQWKRNAQDVRRTGARPLRGEPVQPRLVRFEEIWRTDAELGSAYVAAPKIPTKEVVIQRLSLHAEEPEAEYLSDEYFTDGAVSAPALAPTIGHVTAPSPFLPVESIESEGMGEVEPTISRPPAVPVDPDKWEEPFEVVEEVAIEEPGERKDSPIVRAWGGVTRWYKGLMDDEPIDHSEVPWQPDPNDVEVDLDSVITAGEFDPEAGLEGASGPGAPMEVIESSADFTGPKDVWAGVTTWWGTVKDSVTARMAAREEEKAESTAADTKIDSFEVGEVEADTARVGSVEVDDVVPDDVVYDLDKTSTAEADVIEDHGDEISDFGVDSVEMGDFDLGDDQVGAVADVAEVAAVLEPEESPVKEPEVTEMVLDEVGADWVGPDDVQPDDVQPDDAETDEQVAILGPVPIEDVPAPDWFAVFNETGDEQGTSEDGEWGTEPDLENVFYKVASYDVPGESEAEGVVEEDEDVVELESNDVRPGFVDFVKARVKSVRTHPAPAEEKVETQPDLVAEGGEPTDETATWLSDLMADDAEGTEDKFRSYLHRLHGDKDDTDGA